VSEVLGTGIAFPLHLEDGKLALARDEDDVEQAVLLILSTAPGERPMRPEFGCALYELAFDRIDTQTAGRIDREIRVALDRWEPRIEVEGIEFDFSHSRGPANEGIVEIVLSYRLRHTNEIRNLVYPFYVVPAED
jgi:phage baseplate assembly protein W